MSEKKVTGKQIAADFIVLARDVGTYLAELGKSLYAKLKVVLENAEKQKCESDATN